MIQEGIEDSCKGIGQVTPGHGWDVQQHRDSALQEGRLQHDTGVVWKDITCGQ